MERTKPGEFAWTDLTARDLDAQSAFYEALFGWTRTDVPMGPGSVYRMFSIDGRTVCGASQMLPEMLSAGVPSSWNVYVAVDDVDAALKRAVELGATVAMPSTDVPGGGRFAAFLDPTGAALFLWRAGEPNPAQTYGEDGALAWNDLTTREPEKAAEFYGALFGWTASKLEAGDAPYWQVSPVGAEGEGGIMPMPEMVPPEAPAYWMDYFAVADVAAMTEKAAGLGATVLVPATKVGEMLIFSVLSDSGEAVFALLQPLMPA